MICKKFCGIPIDMNYQNFAGFRDHPAYFGYPDRAFYDYGDGVPPLEANNMTIQDIFRTPFLFLNDHKKNYKDMAHTAMKGIEGESELSKLFFSDTNFKRIQNMIREEVFKRTNGEFKLDIDQEQRDVFLVMRAVYIEHARFKNQIVRQVKKLNRKVVDEAVPGILTNIRQYYGYLRDINGPLRVFPQMGVNVNNAGRRVLPSIVTTFGID